MAPRSTGWWWRAGALTVVIVPIVVAGCRALIRGWSPLGDNGILVVRAADVLTRHNPLLGSWTSASIASGQPVNNPGPLYFDLIALPVKLLGHSVGLAVGVALVNVAAVVFVVLASERLAGRTAMLSLSFAAVLLEWSMGSELLFDVWQPNALVLPGLAFMVAAWGVACGRRWFLPWTVGIGSLLIQTHLSYVYLVPIAILGAAATAVATRSINGELRRPLFTTAAVGLVAWAQPVIEQLASSGRGNFSSLIDASRQETDRIGARLGVRLLAEVVATPPFVGRSSYTEAVPAAGVVGNGDNVPVLGFTWAILAVAFSVAVLVSTGWWQRRRGETAIAALATTVLI
ncbi:MAG: hypothetical protein M3337_07870, partial [Actinomycetota bacterium]|nr:hypothetical protein [Actinomycetota bacterium]